MITAADASELDLYRKAAWYWQSATTTPFNITYEVVLAYLDTSNLNRNVAVQYVIASLPEFWTDGFADVHSRGSLGLVQEHVPVTQVIQLHLKCIGEGPRRDGITAYLEAQTKINLDHHSQQPGRLDDAAILVHFPGQTIDGMRRHAYRALNQSKDSTSTRRTSYKHWWE
jgi:hypothetical protein